jgi:hypothetical protein
MARVPTSLPEAPLKAFIDEVVVPILVERFVRENRGTGAASPTERDGSTKGIAATRQGVSYNVPLRDGTHPSPFSVIAGSSRV